MSRAVLATPAALIRGPVCASDESLCGGSLAVPFALALVLVGTMRIAALAGDQPCDERGSSLADNCRTHAAHGVQGVDLDH